MKYSVFLLNSDDTFNGNVEFGSSASESAAARMALRVANQMKQDACVVNAKGITQRIRWKGLAVVERTETESTERRPYCYNVAPDSTALRDFIVKCIRERRTVTISPSYWTDTSAPIVNATATDPRE